MGRVQHAYRRTLTEPADGQTSLTTDEPYRNVENIQSDAVVYNHGGAAS